MEGEARGRWHPEEAGGNPAETLGRLHSEDPFGKLDPFSQQNGGGDLVSQSSKLNPVKWIERAGARAQPSATAELASVLCGRRRS